MKKLKNESATFSSKNAEDSAADAAACNGRFRLIEYPFVRKLVFTDSDGILDSQIESPFYFQGYDTEKGERKVFIKVWSAVDMNEESVARELELTRQAYRWRDLCLRR